MNQEFRPHPVITDYEAPRDDDVRNGRLKKPVWWDNCLGYLMFCTGGKKYYCHRLAYEVFNRLIKDGLAIDHIDLIEVGINVI